MDDAREQRFKVIENVWIPMDDGCRLAAKIWLPADAERHPVPAVLEYIPYRKRDFKRVRDHQVHGFFAEHGYAGVRVDLRGSGDSDGLLLDEYLPQEIDDGLTVLRWIADQPWCSGRVGMIGLSWGGFNSLQIAALQPPELHAVITVCSSDDRYTDDVHYMGGCLLTDNLSWASVMFSYNAAPPDPEIVGTDWREAWLARLDSCRPWIITWLEHQYRDAYWRHGSICEDFTAIRCPVFAVSGWQDGYCNTVFRLLENLSVPRKGLVGPWGHKYPHMGGPGPAIDFLGECLGWWDRWLKEVDKGVDEEPMLRAWMQDSVSPISDDRPGRWVAEPVWPPPEAGTTEFPLRPGRIALNAPPDGKAAEDEPLHIRSPLHVGLFAGKWCSYAESTDLPTDQRLEDGGALVFESRPLTEDMEILGAPAVAVEISSDKPQAMLAVRLCDVGKDGTVTLVSYGLLNLSHRDGHAAPCALEPGKRYLVRIRLNHIAQRFPAGNRLRVALSTSYWPLAWPAPEPVRLTVYTGASRLSLPVRSPKPLDARLRELGSPRQGQGLPTTLLRPAHREWKVVFNLATNEAVLLVEDNDERTRLDDIGVTIGCDVTERYSYMNDDVSTVGGEVTTSRSFEREGRVVTTDTRTILTSDTKHFRVRASLDAYEGSTRVFSRNWDEWLPRKHL